MSLQKQQQALASMAALRDLAHEGGVLTADGQDVDMEHLAAYAFHTQWLAALPEDEQAWMGAYTQQCFALDDRLAMEGLGAHMVHLLEGSLRTIDALVAKGKKSLYPEARWLPNGDIVFTLIAQ